MKPPLRFLSTIVILILATTTLEAQGNLSEFFSIVRADDPKLTQASGIRISEILDQYDGGKKNLDGEWAVINDALNDPSPFVRNEACAVLSAIISANTAKPIRLPDATRDLVVQRFSELKPKTRENAIRIIVLASGGVPPTLGPRLLEMAKNDSDFDVRRVSIAALASIPMPASEIMEFWIQTLTDKSNKATRGSILNAFSFYAPGDPRLIALVIDALKDTDFFVRQEAIASVIKIGKPAIEALPLLSQIRDGTLGFTEHEESIRLNAESAIRILSTPPPNR